MVVVLVVWRRQTAAKPKANVFIYYNRYSSIHITYIIYKKNNMTGRQSKNIVMLIIIIISVRIANFATTRRQRLDTCTFWRVILNSDL